MKLELHPEAAKNFNLKAEGLLAELTSIPRVKRQGHQGPLDPDIHVVANFKPEDIIGDVKVTHIDYYGGGLICRVKITQTYTGWKKAIGGLWECVR